jgi:Fe-S cluster assembly protein SufD
MDLKKIISSFMAFEEYRCSFELYDECTAAIKKLENKGIQQKKKESGSTLQMPKNDFTVFPKHESAVEFSQEENIF